MKLKIKKVIASIEEKIKKLNDLYTKFEKNWLYVFAPSLFSDIDIPEVYDNYKKILLNMK